MKNKKSAFTLIELSATIVIVGFIITSVAFYGGGLIRAVESNIKKISGAASPKKPDEIPDLIKWFDASDTSYYSYKNSNPDCREVTNGVYQIKNKVDATDTLLKSNHATNRCFGSILSANLNSLNTIGNITQRGSDSLNAMGDAKLISDTIIMVMKGNITGPIFGHYEDRGANRGKNSIRINGTGFAYRDAQINFAIDSSKWYIYVLNFDKTSMHLSVNGEFIGKSDYTIFSPYPNGLFPVNFCETSRNDNVRIYCSGSMDMAEIIFYDKILSEQEALSIESYLGAKWDIPIAKSSNSDLSEYL